MVTKFKPIVSAGNPSYISKHRYYELKHFCLQYPEWKAKYRDLQSYIYTKSVVKTCKDDGMVTTNLDSIGIELSYISKNIDLIEQTCDEVDSTIARYLLLAITEERTYSNLKTVYDIPCGREYFYVRYRKFFYILDKKRG